MELRLPLKKKWFEMTKAGIKTEDYREITPYWIKRFLMDIEVLDPSIDYEELSKLIKEKSLNVRYSFIEYRYNTMTLGYPKSTDTDRIIQFEHAGIEIRTGNPEWGAEPNKLYFVIKHGKAL